MRSTILYFISKSHKLNDCDLFVTHHKRKPETRFSAVRRHCLMELKRKPTYFPFHRLCLRIICVQPTILKLGASNYFLWVPNVLYWCSCLNLVPLFRDSHLACCVIENFHNVLLPTWVVEKVLGLFTHNEVHILGCNCLIEANQWLHSRLYKMRILYNTGWLKKRHLLYPAIDSQVFLKTIILFI